MRTSSLFQVIEVLKDYAARIAFEMAHASVSATASQQLDMDTNASASLTSFKDFSDFEFHLANLFAAER